MSEVAEKTAEVVADQVEDAIDGVVEVVEVVKNNPMALIAVGLVGVAAGTVGGYFLAQKLLSHKFEEQMTEEIAEARAFYANLNKVSEDGAVLSPQDVLAARHGQEAVDAVREYQGRTEEDAIAEAQDSGEPFDDEQDEAQIRKIENARIHSVSVDKEPGPHGGTIEVTETKTERNVFRDDTFDLEEEIKFRTEDKPYIITHDEYFAGEKDYDTQSLTYYEVDDTLTDEHDKPLEQTDKQVGDDHLVRFGSGSKDPNVVYVRNDRLGIDYEIVRSKGSYLEEVLGMPEENPGELKHSDQRDRRRAMQRDDG